MTLSDLQRHLPTARFFQHAFNCVRFCFWRRQSLVFCLCLKYIGNSLTDYFAPNSLRRPVWAFARTSLKVEVKGQGHQGQKRHFSALLAA